MAVAPPTLYNMSPAWLQSLAVSAQGWRFRAIRQSAHARATYEFLEDSQWWSREDLARYQDATLEQFLTHAYESVPLHRARWDEIGLRPRDVTRVDDLPKVPIMSTAEIRRDPTRAYSTAFEGAKLFTAYTSGTTGSPFTAHFTYEDVAERFALLTLVFNWYTPGWRPKRASFTGRLVIPGNRTKGPLSRLNLPMNQRLFTAHHLQPDLLRRSYDDLVRYEPELIDGLLSPVFVIAQAARQEGYPKPVWAPDALILNSETLWEHMRSSIEEVFSAPVANQYGSQEGAPIAAECPSGSFHVFPQAGVFEILDKHGEPAPEGEMGRLVITSFNTRATPLIRYEIGDVASWKSGPCPCGRETPLLGSIHGRVDDMLYTRDRGIISRLDPAMKELSSAMLATQIAQISLTRFEARIAAIPGTVDPHDVDHLLENLHHLIGENVSIEPVMLDEIPVSAGGKVKAMVNECRDLDELREIREAWDAYQ